MVAIRASEADRFLSALQDYPSIYLLFGTDAGLVSERAIALAEHKMSGHNDKPLVLRFEGDALVSDPGPLWDEVQSVGLFSDTHSIRIKVGNKNLTPLIADILQERFLTSRLILEAGALKKDAPLRKLVEQSKNSIALECNLEDRETISKYILKDLRSSNITIEPEALDLILSLLDQDRLSYRSEIEKLKLYIMPNKCIFPNNVRQCLSGTNITELDDIIKIVFGGQFEKINQIRNYLLAGQTDPSAFLIFMMRHAMLLHKIKSDMSSGMGLDQAMTRAGWMPYQLRHSISAQSVKWSETNLTRTIKILSLASSKARRNSGEAVVIADRACWTITRIAARS